MIKTTAIGHLGKDCIVNEVNGKSVINFSVAHSDRYKDANGIEHQKTIWLECSLWRDSLAIANYLKKGQLVYVEGIPEVRIFQKREGDYGANIRLRISQIQLLGSNQNSNTNQQTEPIYKPSEEENLGDDLPF